GPERRVGPQLVAEARAAVAQIGARDGRAARRMRAAAEQPRARLAELGAAEEQADLTDLEPRVARRQVRGGLEADLVALAAEPDTFGVMVVHGSSLGGQRDRRPRRELGGDQGGHEPTGGSVDADADDGPGPPTVGDLGRGD